MKYLLTLFFFLFISYSFSQTNNEIKYYKDDLQKGYHILLNGKWKQHGVWKSHYGKAKFEHGKLVWIKIGNNPKLLGTEIRLIQLENRVKKLKQELASN